MGINPFMVLAGDKISQSPVDPTGVLDKLQGKTKDPLTEATFKGDAKKVKQYSDRKKATERARMGDTETLSQKAKKTRGTWENAVERARRALKIKPGNDQLLKSALYVAKDVVDGSVSDDDYNEVISLMRTAEGKAELKSRIERFRNPIEDDVTIDAQSPEQREQSKASIASKARDADLGKSGLFRKSLPNAPLSLEQKLNALYESYMDSLSRGGTTLIGLNGEEITFPQAERIFAKYGIQKPGVLAKTDEELAIDKADTVGILPKEGLQGEGFKQSRERAVESSVANISAGAKSPFAMLAEAASPAFKESRERLGEQTIEEGGSARDARLNMLKFQDLQGDVGSAFLSLGANYGGMGLKGLAMLDAADVITQLPGVIARAKTEGVGSVGLELAMVLLTGSASSGDLLEKPVKELMDSPSFQREAMANLVKSGMTPDEAGDALKAIDEIPEQQLDDALGYTFRQKEPTGGDVGVEFRKPSVDDVADPAEAKVIDSPNAIPNPSEIPNSSIPDVQQIEDVQRTVNTNDILETPNNVDNVSGIQKYDESVIADSAVEELGAPKSVLAEHLSSVEKRIAELEAKGAKPRTKQSGGLDPDILELATLKAYSLVVKAGVKVEDAVRTIIKELGLSDNDFDEIQKDFIQKHTAQGMAHADTAKLRDGLGMPEYEKTTRPLEELAEKAKDVDIRKSVKDVLYNPRPFTDVEEYAARGYFQKIDNSLADLKSQYSNAVERGDSAQAMVISDAIDNAERELAGLIEATDKAGSETGRALRARQLEITNSKDPQNIRYRLYKNAGGNPTPNEKSVIDDLISKLEAETKLRKEAESKAEALKSQGGKSPRKTSRQNAANRVQSLRPPRKIDDLIARNNADLEDWKRRWAKANVGGKQGGGTTIPMAVEGAYYIAKGELLKGVRTLDDIIKAVRDNGLNESMISEDDIQDQILTALDDINPKRPKNNKPTARTLRNEIANRTGRVSKVEKVKKSSGNSKKTAGDRRVGKKANKGDARRQRANSYETSIVSLNKEVDDLIAQLRILKTADSTGEQFIKFKAAVDSVSRKVNKGRAYGKDVLAVGNIGNQSDDVVKLRDKLDWLRSEFSFEEQAVNASGNNYINIIKNIEDIESNKTLSPLEKQKQLNDMYRILNQGKEDGNGFFRNGEFGIESPEVAKARAREDAVMSDINRHLSKIKKAAERGEMSKAKRLASDFVSAMGGVKTLLLSGEAGFLGRQAWMPLMTRPKTAYRALKDMKNSVKQRAFDFTLAELKSNPFYEQSQKSGLYISDPSSAVREEDFMTSYFEQMANSDNAVVKGAGEGLEAYSGLNERVYNSFLNRVRMDLFQSMAESAGRSGPLTDDDFKAFATIVNDMTGRTSVPPSMDHGVNIANHLLISTRYYLSRLKILSGANLVTKTKASKIAMAKEYGRFLGSLATLGFTINYLHDKHGLPVEMELDPRATNFGKIKLPNNVSIELDAGLRPFVNLITRLGIVGFENHRMKTGEDRFPNYITSKGVEVRDSDYTAHYAKPLGLGASFLALRSNPIFALAMKDLSKGESFGRDTNIYKEYAKSPVPIIAQNAYNRYKDGESIDAQALAFLLEFFGLGGNIMDDEVVTGEPRDIPAKSPPKKKEPTYSSIFD